MSTGLNCIIIEYKPGEWYYILEHGSAPKQAWDWREYASAYGPFKSSEAAIENLGNNHANPGGWWTVAYEADRKDEVLDKLIANAARPTRSGGIQYGDGTYKTGPFIFLPRRGR